MEEVQILDKPVSEPVMEAPPQLTEEQNALAVLQQSLNEFIKKLNHFPGSKSQIVRAWTNASISPLNKDEFTFSYEAEKELFELATTINSAKLALMIYGFVREGKLAILKPLLEDSEQKPSEAQLEEIEKDPVAAYAGNNNMEKINE